MAHLRPLVFGPYRPRPTPGSRENEERLLRLLTEAPKGKTMPVRAKFRCMSITHRWDESTIVHLRPVTKKKYEHGKESMNFAENAQFWRYTPSGECKLYFKAGTEPFKVGSYYYIDMEQDAAGRWNMGRTERWGTTGSGRAQFYCGHSADADQQGGEFEIQVEGTEAGPGAATIDNFGPPDGKWSFTFSLAHDHTIES